VSLCLDHQSIPEATNVDELIAAEPQKREKYVEGPKRQDRASKKSNDGELGSQEPKPVAANPFKIRSIQEKQYDSLIKINILPLRLRYFFRLCTFIFNIIKNKNSFFTPIYLAHRNLLNTRNQFNIPKFKKPLKNILLYLYLLVY